VSELERAARSWKISLSGARGRVVKKAVGQGKDHAPQSFVSGSADGTGAERFGKT
jgi:UDP-N-acetyl-D-mannosaminuronic acid transferase (WecB/TagA/CpsF family)